MERSEAFRTLRLDASADGALVESAYWQLVRQAQNADDTSAQGEIDRLNEARDLLAPKGVPPAASMRAPRAGPSNAGDMGIATLEKMADWVWAEGLRIRQRWPDRNVEMGVIAGTTIVLMVIALGAGAPAWWTFALVGVLLGTIWAPWRKL